MPCRAGITTRPDERKKEWKQKEPTMRNWKLVGPFPSREAAQAWEDQQLLCTKHGGGSDPDGILTEWYGYRFDY